MQNDPLDESSERLIQEMLYGKDGTAKDEKAPEDNMKEEQRDEQAFINQDGGSGGQADAV